jgi:hypothetical protein
MRRRQFSEHCFSGSFSKADCGYDVGMGVEKRLSDGTPNINLGRRMKNNFWLRVGTEMFQVRIE